MTNDVNTTQTTRVTRAYYQDARKPDTEKMKGDAAVGGGKGTTETYHPFGDENRDGVKTKYSNGNEVTIWDCEDANGIVTKATAIKIGNKTYYDWESDGKIDCVDAEEVVKDKKEEIKESVEHLRIDLLQRPNIGI